MTVKISKPAVNLREELNELKKPTGVAGEAMLRAETPQEQFNLIGAGRRNLLINGDFQVSQRGDFTTASTATNNYWVDRWYADVSAPVSVNKQHTTGIDIDGTPTIAKAAKLIATSGGTSYIGLRQKIENGTQYVGRTLTYSAYVKSNSSNARLTSYIVGSNNQVVVSEPHSGSGEWERLTVTFVMTGTPSSAWFVSAFISTPNIGSIPMTTGEYIEITMAQMELGKVATPFEHRSYGEELALCQRYYEQWSGSMAMHPQYSAISSGVYANAREVRINFKSTKRATPTCTVAGTTTPSAVSIDVDGFGAQSSSTSATASVRVGDWTADAEL
jgi:hypothetical protein